MGLKASTKWKLDRDLGEPEDEFFGLLEEDELPGEDPAKQNDKVPFLQRIIHSLVLKEDQPQEDTKEELEDVRAEPTVGSSQFDSELESTIIRLPAGREWDDFLQAEQQANLFETIQVTKRKRLKAAAFALWLSAALFAYIGLKSGSSYLTSLTDQGIVGSDWLVSRFGAQAAQGITVTLGIMAPVAAFLLSASSLALLIGGAYEKRLPRAIVGIMGLCLMAVSLSLMGSGSYVAAAALAAGGWLALRLLERLMLRLGVY